MSKRNRVGPGLALALLVLASGLSGVVASVATATSAEAQTSAPTIDGFRAPAPDDSPSTKLCTTDLQKANGGMWYTRWNCTYPSDPSIPEGRIGFVRSDGTFSEVAMPGRKVALHLATDAGDGHVWFSYVIDRNYQRPIVSPNGGDSYTVVCPGALTGPSTDPCPGQQVPAYYGIGRINPSTMAITTWDQPRLNSTNMDGLITGPDGNIYWIVRSQVQKWDCSAYGGPSSGAGGYLEQGFIDKLDPRTFPSSPTFTSYPAGPVGGIETYGAYANEQSLAFGRDGKLYFGLAQARDLADSPPCTDRRTPAPTQWYGGKLFQFDPATNSSRVAYNGYVNGVTAANADGRPQFTTRLDVGPDGNIWVARTSEGGIRGVSKYDVATGAVRAYDALFPANNVFFANVAAGSDGNLWWVSGTSAYNFNPTTEVLGSIPIPAGQASPNTAQPPFAAGDIAWYNAPASGHISVIRPGPGNGFSIPVPSGIRNPATVGENFAPGEMRIYPQGFGVAPGETSTIEDIQITPSCSAGGGGGATGPACSSFDPGVFRINPFVNTSGTCANRSLTATEIDASKGLWQFVVNDGKGPLVAPINEASGGVVNPNGYCILNFVTQVLKLPVDVDPAAAEAQTYTHGFVIGTRGAGFRLNGNGGSTVTVLPQPTFSLSMAPAVPGNLTVAQTNVAGHVGIYPHGSARQAGETVTVNEIQFLPACPVGVTASAFDASGGINCSNADPGVLRLNSSATGSGTCAGRTFAVSAPINPSGTVRFTTNDGSGPLVLPLNDPPPGGVLDPSARCDVNFTFDVVKQPKDSDAARAGAQTQGWGFATGCRSNSCLFGTGATGTTIDLPSFAINAIGEMDTPQVKDGALVNGWVAITPISSDPAAVAVVDSIQFMPACPQTSAFAGARLQCADPDPGVYAIDPGGNGTGSCAGRTFTHATIEPATGLEGFTVVGAALALPVGQECRVNFIARINKMPKDNDPAKPGNQKFNAGGVQAHLQSNAVTTATGVGNAFAEVFPGDLDGFGISAAATFWSPSDVGARGIVGAAFIHLSAGAPTPGETGVVHEIQFVPCPPDSQGTWSGTGPSCPNPDPGVYNITPLTGTTSNTCPGRTVSIALIDAAQGKWRITPNDGRGGIVVPLDDLRLPPPGDPDGTTACRIDFTADVLKMPRDADPSTPDRASIFVPSWALATRPAQNQQSWGTGVGVAEVTRDLSLGVSAVPSTRSPVIVGETNVPANTAVLVSANSPAPGETAVINDIQTMPSCTGGPGQTATGMTCATPDRGVFRPSLTATGSGKCAGRTFAVTEIDATAGIYRFTPNDGLGPVNIALSRTADAPVFPDSYCVVNYTLEALKLPRDSDAATAGEQTTVNSFAIATRGANTGRGGGNGVVTVSPGAFAIGSGASIDPTPQTVGQVVSGRVSIHPSGDLSTMRAVIDRIWMIPACPVTPAWGASGPTCSDADPGVYAIDPGGTGVDGCAGRTFTHAITNAATGLVEVTPVGGPVILPVGQSCTVQFSSVRVLKLPKDFNAAEPGAQTFHTGFALGHLESDPTRESGGFSTQVSTVFNPNLAPIVYDDYVMTRPSQATTVPVLVNDDPIEASQIMDPASVTIVSGSGPFYGTVRVNADGSVTYTPSPGYSGFDLFDYRACDNGVPALCDVGRVDVEVVPDSVAGLGRMPS